MTALNASVVEPWGLEGTNENLSNICYYSRNNLNARNIFKIIFKTKVLLWLKRKCVLLQMENRKC